MQLFLRMAVVLVLPFAVTSTVIGADLFRVLGIGPRGSDCEGSCGDAACGCGADCGCDPTCEFNAVNGRKFAGQTWSCCRECGPPICTCTGSASCSHNCDCNGSQGCGRRGCLRFACLYGTGCGRLVGMVDRYCGCTGCDSELYWSEWHNDPPRCCDPCDCYGNWVGGGQGGYRAPYDHPYFVGGEMYARSHAGESGGTPVGGITRRPETGSNTKFQR